jgi:pseudaminic acid biosynthesis-associated methylase
MSGSTPQIAAWTGDFGKEYTDRNVMSTEELDAMYRRNFGVSRTELNVAFIGGMDRSIRILEVGSNVGNQLLLLQHMGFKALYGIEVQPYAVELSKMRSKGINIIEGTAFDIPFKDDYFGLVLTSGLLIHISPSDTAAVMREIHRCTREYIWGFEYYADECTEVTYRNHKNLLWKADFAKLYLQRFSDLSLVTEKRIKYLDGDNTDSMFLLRKKAKTLGNPTLWMPQSRTGEDHPELRS